MAGSDHEESNRVRVRRAPERGLYDRDTIDEILDVGMICHVGYQADHGPVVLPTLYGRSGDVIYIHGSPAAGMFRNSTRPDVCLTVTHTDGIVLARSLMHHSMNYRSVTVLGKMEIVSDPDEIIAGLKAITENVIAGRWDEARQPNEDELRQTLVAKIPLGEASAKVRTGPPGDGEEDLSLDIWAGVVPIATAPGEPIPAPNLSASLVNRVPMSVAGLIRGK